MIIILDAFITEANYSNIQLFLTSHNIQFYPVQFKDCEVIVCMGNNNIDIRSIGNLKGVSSVYRIAENYKLVSKQWKHKYSTIAIGKHAIGPQDFQTIAGPCSVENEQQIDAIAQQLNAENIKLIRGGVFKPRTSPYAFRGLGISGLKMFYSIAQSYDLGIVTEVVDQNDIDLMYPYVDVFQVGARNAQNFNLLEALGKIDKPILLKRGISGTIDELLQSAEYIYSKGNDKIILCERGIRNFETSYRNSFDINAISILKEKTHLPVIADPSHGIGLRKHISNIALAAIVAGADGVIIETHNEPEAALSDGMQSLDLKEFQILNQKIQQILTVL